LIGDGALDGLKDDLALATRKLVEQRRLADPTPTVQDA
jgi:hypothetical protein